METEGGPSISQGEYVGSTHYQIFELRRCSPCARNNAFHPGEGWGESQMPLGLSFNKVNAGHRGRVCHLHR